MSGYTTDEKEKLKALYEEHGTDGIEKVAAEMNKSVPSVRSVLVRLGIYIPAGKKETPKKRGKSKGDLIKELCEVTGLKHKGIDNATKECILELTQYIKALKGVNGQI